LVQGAIQIAARGLMHREQPPGTLARFAPGRLLGARMDAHLYLELC
jgi:hypothetical protein